MTRDDDAPGSAWVLVDIMLPAVTADPTFAF
jgi:hypothetical protein